MFASSVEVYGENRGDVEKFDESYLGYIDCNTPRAGYPESKRCGEALCQAYKKRYGLDVVIPRLSRIYGPTMLSDDSKASSQFIRKAIAGENIVLKSAGEQFYSYTYVTDAVSALLTVLLKGENGEAYNIADENSDIRLKDMAKLCAEAVGTKVVFEIPDANEAAGYSKSTVARLSNEKIKGLSWQAETNIESGIKKTIDIYGSSSTKRKLQVRFNHMNEKERVEEIVKSLEGTLKAPVIPREPDKTIATARKKIGMFSHGNSGLIQDCALVA